MFLAPQGLSSVSGVLSSTSVRSRAGNARAKSKHVPRYHGMKLESLQHAGTTHSSPQQLSGEAKLEAATLLTRTQVCTKHTRLLRSTSQDLLVNMQAQSRQMPMADPTAVADHATLPYASTGSLEGQAAATKPRKARTLSRQLKRSFEDERLPDIPPAIRQLSERDDLEVIVEEDDVSGCCSIRGLKPGHPKWTNQDSYLILESPEARPDCRVFVVLDGHGELGHLVSRKCRDTLPTHLCRTNYDLRRACSELQEMLVSHSSDIDVRCSGATCAMVMMTASKLQVWWHKIASVCTRLYYTRASAETICCTRKPCGRRLRILVTPEWF
jgi:hypothetical protein